VDIFSGITMIITVYAHKSIYSMRWGGSIKQQCQK